MRISPEQSSLWMVELDKQLHRGKQVLLYGNVTDQFLLNGRYVPLDGFLNEYFTSEGYGVVGYYDVVDGLKLIDPDSMQPAFDDIISRAMGGAAQTPTPSPDPAPATPNAAPPRSMPRAGAGLPSTAPRLQQPQQALDAIRHSVRQSGVASAFVVDFTDKLVSDPQQQQEAERLVLVQLKKVVQEAAFIPSGPLAGRRNAVVTVAGQLGGVPPWFHQDNPFLALVQVGKPRLEERVSFVRTFIANFSGGRELGAEQVEEVAGQVGDLTDGLAAWDLESIRRTSVAEGLSVARPKVLVDYYKYGQREDPWERLDPTKIGAARETINQRVIGQPAAVDAVVDMLVSARVGISMSEVTAKSGKPRGTFFFVGPTGVGKTELAKSLTELIFSDDTAFDRYDMSEFAEQHAAEKLTGSPPGFVGYEEGGRLTERVMHRPFNLLLFDEVEKAHPRVMDKFLQILEDGRLTDGKGQTAYFSQSVIIFTSNIGSDTVDACGPSPAALPDYESIREHYLNAVREHFTHTLGRPELLNRLGDNVLVFDMLRPQHITGIAGKFLQALAGSAREKRGLTLSFEQPAITDMIQSMMLEGDNMRFGGRRIKTLVEGAIERPLNRWVFFNAPPAGATLTIAPTADGRTITINGTSAM